MTPPAERPGHFGAFVGDERTVLQRPSQQCDGVLDVLQSGLAEAPRMEGVSAQEVVAERPCRPDAELRPALRVHAVPDGQDGVEVVKPYGLVGSGNVQKTHTAFFRQFAALEHVAEMSRDDRPVPVEERRHLSLRQPYAFRAEPDVESDFAVRGFEEDQIAAVAAMRGFHGDENEAKTPIRTRDESGRMRRLNAQRPNSRRSARARH